MSKTRFRTTRTTSLALLLGALTTACGSIATGSSELALQYEGGMVESNAYYSCVDQSGVRDYIDWGDVAYYYPTGQRDFSFRGDGRGADAAQITSTTSDGQDTAVSGTVKFTLDLSCREFTDSDGKKWPGGKAQFFHEKIGNKDPNQPAYNKTGSESYGDGWSKMLREYIGFAVNDALDATTPNYSMDDLSLRPDEKTNWESAVRTSLPKTLKTMTFNVDIFRIDTVILNSPGVRSDVADARAAKVVANEQVAASNVIAQRAKTWPGGLPAYQEFLREQAVNKAIADGKIKAVPVPYGSPVIVPQN